MTGRVNMHYTAFEAGLEKYMGTREDFRRGWI